MVRDAEVFHSKIGGSGGHFFQTVLAVAGGGVVMKGASQILQLDELRQSAFLRSLNLTHVFP